MADTGKTKATTGSAGCSRRHAKRRRISGAVANNQKDGIDIFGTIPVHLLAIMGHERAGRHRYTGVGGSEIWARANPPCPRQHCDKTITGMKMRLAEMVARKP